MANNGLHYTDKQKAELILLWKSYGYNYKRVKEQTGISHTMLKAWIESPLGEQVLSQNSKEEAGLMEHIEHQNKLAEKQANDFYGQAFKIRKKLLNKIDDLIDVCKEGYEIKHLVSALKVVDSIIEGEEPGENGGKGSKHKKTWVTNIIQKIDNQININDKINKA